MRIARDRQGATILPIEHGLARKLRVVALGHVDAYALYLAETGTTPAGILTEPSPKDGHHSCGTAVDSHHTFPVTWLGWSPNQPAVSVIAWRTTSGSDRPAMKFSIVTPCYNAVALLPETVASVLGQRAVQSGQVELEYWICDGGSTDGTLEWLRRHPHPAVRVISEPDQGMYDALAKGLSRATGDVVAYLNAGDIYYPQAFGVVAEIMATGQVDWLTGYRVIYNQHSQVIQVDLPYPYRRELFAFGLYNRAWCRVQQESTFWTQKVHQTLDLRQLKTWRYAGDYFLWMQLAQVTDLQVVQSYLGGFKRHPGQLSQQREAYNREVAQMTQPVPLWAKGAQVWDWWQWRWRRTYPGVWRFDPKINKWRRW